MIKLNYLIKISKIKMLKTPVNDYSNDAPPTPQSKIEISDINYNCTECSSLIEILSINEDNNCIEFKCLNKENNHEKK